jgi:hypothetical protein
MSWKSFVPRVVKVRTPPAYVPTPDRPEDAVHWWAEDRYVDFRSVRALRWAGVNWVTWRYNKFPDAYFAPADDIVELIGEMTRAGLVPPLTAASRVFEGGSNLGRNLWAIRKAYGCAVTGMDISPAALRTAKERIWKGMDRVTFQLENVLTTAWFDSVPDGHYDLAFTRWHLIHIPHGPEKARYLANLRRISKAFFILEPVSRERTGTIEFQMDGQICHSWDDWAAEYGLTEHRPKVAFENTSVFYAAR